MYKVLIPILLVGLVASFQDTKTILAEIDSNQFGNALLSLVQVQIQSKGSADEVNLLLNQIVAGITADQNNHDKVRRVEESACNRIVNDLDQTVAYHVAQVNAQQQLREDNTKALADAENDLRQVIKDIESNEKTQGQEQANRDSQHNTWVQKDAEHSDAISSVDEATKLVQHLQLGASFSQLKGKFDAVQKKLQENKAHSTLLQVLIPIVTALTELATEVDFKAIQKILQLLQQLRQQLWESQQLLQETEEKQAARWGEFSTHLTTERARLGDRKSQLEQAISSYKENIETAIHFYEVHQLEAEASQDAQTAQREWCEQQERVYDASTQERAQQQDVVQRIQTHIAEKLSATQQYLAGRF